jgi:chitodextrinase
MDLPAAARARLKERAKNGFRVAARALTRPWPKLGAAARGFSLAQMVMLVAGLVPLAVVAALNAGVATSAGSDPVIAAAGDIACDPANSNFDGGQGTSDTCRQLATSNLLVNKGLAAVLPLGDIQYYCGSYEAFKSSYDLSWGRVKGITRPVVGNHEYLTHGSSGGATGCDSTNEGAAGYWDYFNGPGQLNGIAGRRGKGYYSFDIGSWHLIALNSNCGDVGGCSSGSEQGRWLEADLAAHPDRCTLAYWHIPLFSSGGRQASNTQSFWEQLQAARADVVLAGHDHIYERFAPQRADGTADSVNGIRSFVVGTGGANHTSMASTARNSELRHTGTYGVLMLTLHPTSYSWRFQPEAGATFTDSGSDPCHRTGGGGGSDTTAPTAPTGLAGTVTSGTRIDLTWNASSDNVAVAGYRIYRGGAQIATSTSTGYSDTSVQPGSTYSYYVRAFDAAGNVSGQSGTVNVTTPPDTTAPTAPTGLNGTAASETRINLSWNASTDNVGVVRYRVLRDGAEIGTSTTRSYADTKVQPSATYSYQVRAEDAAGNVSGPSTAVVVTTPDTTAPVAPTGLSGSAAGATQVSLSWNASADNVGVAGYRIFRDGAEIGTSTATSYADTGVEPGSTHGYQVRAYDGAGNASGPSNSVSVTTPLAPPPPGGGQALTSTFTPSDDATVAEGQPTTNFGSGPLEADASPKKDFLLRFALSGIGNGTVKSAKLRLYCIDPSSSGGRVREAEGAWDEATVTWRTAPAAGSTGPAALGGVSSGRWYEIDVTQLVKGDGPAGFRVGTTSGDGVDYASKETSTKPELVVDWESAPPPPPVFTAPLGGLPLTAVPGGTSLASPGTSATAGTQPAVGVRGIGRTVGKLRRKGLLVLVECPAESCVAKARGTLSRRSSRRKLELRSTGARIAAGAKASLRLRLSRAALVALRRARARHEKLVLVVVVEIRFDSGQTTTLRRTLRL